MRAEAEPPRADLRRYPRARVAWRVIVEVPGGRPMMRETVDFSPYGTKVRMSQRLTEGTEARLRFSTPDRQPLHLDAVVRRLDPEGPALEFLGVAEAQLARLKALVDAHRRN